MKAKSLIPTALLLICVAGFSCTVTPPTKCGPCPLYAEVAPYIEVKIVDKTTGADLFLSPTSPYKFADLKITSSLAGSLAYFNADTTQTDNRFVRILSTESQTFKLKLAALSADSISVVAKRDSPVCCPRLRITEIKLDNVKICSPCTLSELLTIKK